MCSVLPNLGYHRHLWKCYPPCGPRGPIFLAMTEGEASPDPLLSRPPRVVRGSDAVAALDRPPLPEHDVAVLVAADRRHSALQRHCSRPLPEDFPFRARRPRDVERGENSILPVPPAKRCSTAAEPAAAYDAIFCMAVLRHGSLGRLRPSHSLRRLRGDGGGMSANVQCLMPGGLLVIRHSNFRLCDAPAGAAFETVLRVLTTGKMPLFGPDNRLMVGGLSQAPNLVHGKYQRITNQNQSQGAAKRLGQQLRLN